MENFHSQGVENGRLLHKMGEITLPWEIRISSKSQGICISITENGLVFSPKKTQVILFHRKNKLEVEGNLFL